MKLTLQKNTVHIRANTAFEATAAMPVVLCFHGAGQDSRIWQHTIDALASKGLAVLAPDLPGHGQSGGKALGSIAEIAQWAQALLDALGADKLPLCLIGHSMGSLIALDLAARRRARLGALILIGAASPMAVAPDLIQAAQNNPEKAHEIINHWSFVSSRQLPGIKTSDPNLLKQNLAMMQAQPNASLSIDLTACAQYGDALNAAAKVTAPTLFIHGEHDRMTPRHRADSLREAIVAPQQSRTIAHTGHALLQEAPGTLAQCLNAFLASILFAPPSL